MVSLGCVIVLALLVISITIDDTRATLREMAGAVIRSKGSASAIATIPPDAARQQTGAFADALLLDQNVSSAWTLQHLGWVPKREFISSVGEQWKEFS